MVTIKTKKNGEVVVKMRGKTETVFTDLAAIAIKIGQISQSMRTVSENLGYSFEAAEAVERRNKSDTPEHRVKAKS